MLNTVLTRKLQLIMSGKIQNKTSIGKRKIIIMKIEYYMDILGVTF